MDYRLSEIDHRYGPGVHILEDPFLTTQLATLCSPDTFQPQVNQLATQLYTSLVRVVINAEFPRVWVESPTRMIDKTPRGVFRGEVINRSTPVVVVDVARAGMLPSQVCYDTFNTTLDPKVVRQDHLMMARITGASHKVEGAAMHGQKIGGPVDRCIVIFPDPMGATGGSLAEAIKVYASGNLGKPRKIITMNLIVTPQFLKRMKKVSEELGVEIVVYAVRVDRGMSSDEVLACVPGERWDEENGLNEEDYIVPGGGGFGELMNNSWC